MRYTNLLLLTFTYTGNPQFGIEKNGRDPGIKFINKSLSVNYN